MGPDEKLGSPPAIQSVSAPVETVRDQDKIMLVLAYLGILALIPLLTVKDSEFVKWHARQGLVLGVGGFIVLTIIGFVPFIGWCLSPLLAIGLLGASVYGIIQAFKGLRFRFPVVAGLAEKINL